MNLITSGDCIKIHDFSTYDLLHEYQSESCGMIQDISFNSNGQYISLLPIVGKVEILNIKENLKFSHNVPKVLLILRQMNILNLRLCKLGCLKEEEFLTKLLKLDYFDGSPTAISFMKQNINSLAIGSLNGISLWDCSIKNTKHVYEAKNINTLDFNCNDTLLAADNHKEIFVFNTQTDVCSTLSSSLYNNISLIKFHYKRPHILVCCTYEGSLLFWNCIELKTEKYILNSQPSIIEDCAFSKFNQKLISTVGKNQITIYDIKNSKPVFSLQSDYQLNSIDLSSDGNNLAVGTLNGFILLYDMRSFSKPFKTWKAHSTKISRLRFKSSIHTLENKSFIVQENISQTSFEKSHSVTKSEITCEVEDSFMQQMKVEDSFQELIKSNQSMNPSPITVPATDLSKRIKACRSTLEDDSFLAACNEIFTDNKSHLNEVSINVSMVKDSREISQSSQIGTIVRLDNKDEEKTEESSTITPNNHEIKNYLSTTTNTINPLKKNKLSIASSMMTPTLNAEKDCPVQESPAMFNCLAHSTPNAPLKDNEIIQLLDTKLENLLDSKLNTKFNELDMKLDKINSKMEDMENKLKDFAKKLYINYVHSSTQEYLEFRELFHLLLSQSTPNNRIIAEVLKLRQENALLKTALEEKNHQ